MPIDKRDDLISGAEACCRQLASYAVAALLEEAALYPKPGLVDPVSAGAHSDMDITAFVRSAAALPFGFYDYARIGSESVLPEAEPAAIRRRLRTTGLALEQAMFAATGGINTHKGAVFLFGYLLAAAGRMYGKRLLPDELEGAALHGAGLPSAESADGTDRPFLPMGKLSAADFFSELRVLAAGLFEEDMERTDIKKAPTHGEQMFLQYGCKGIRGAVEAGLPLVERNLPYMAALAELPQRDSYLLTLLHIIAENEDTNVLYRAGTGGLKALQERCAALLEAKLTGTALYRAVELLDADCITQNISPGGSADLFAAVLFCRNIINREKL
ncbi:MAG: triphosphoribosyl-dephospho-CoA synthase [Treponema sp.]